MGTKQKHCGQMKGGNATGLSGEWDLLFTRDHPIVMMSSTIAVAFAFCSRNQSNSCYYLVLMISKSGEKNVDVQPTDLKLVHAP